MRTFLIFLFVLVGLAFLSKAEFTSLQWADCGSPQVRFLDMAVKPMPILQPGTMSLTFKANLLRGTSGKLRTDINIIRTIAGLALPVRCYLTSGIYAGSCVYDDFCAVIAQVFPETFNPSACTPELAEYGIDCTCPFKIRSGNVDLTDILLDLPDLSDPNIVFGFLGKGDFDITIKTEDVLGKFACLRIKYTMKPNFIGK